MDLRDCIEYLYENRAEAMPPRAFAQLLDLLCWRLQDNGAEVDKVREAWLDSDEVEKVRIALAMEDSYPYSTIEEMTTHFARISTRWPELREQCDALLAQRLKL